MEIMVRDEGESKLRCLRRVRRAKKSERSEDAGIMHRKTALLQPASKVATSPSRRAVSVTRMHPLGWGNLNLMNASASLSIY